MAAKIGGQVILRMYVNQIVNMASPVHFPIIKTCCIYCFDTLCFPLNHNFLSVFVLYLLADKSAGLTNIWHNVSFQKHFSYGEVICPSRLDGEICLCKSDFLLSRIFILSDQITGIAR